MSAENQAELLVPVEIIAKRDRLGLGRQLFGASGRSPHLTHTVSTPWGAVAIGREGARVTAHGDQIPVAAIEAPDPVGMAHVRRGLSGRVDGRDVRVVRPHFGLRRKDRSVLVDGEGIAWRSDYRRSRQFDILRRDDGSVVFRQDGAKKLIDPQATPAEVSLALVLSASGIIQTSSLLNGLTFP